MKTWEGFEKFIPKLDYFAKNIAAIGKKCYEPNKAGSGFNVLNHGDFHLRNTLLKMNSDDRIESFRFVSSFKTLRSANIFHLFFLDRFSIKCLVQPSN